MRRAGRFCWRAAASPPRCAPGLRARDFVEVETTALQVSPGNETHLHAFATELIGPGGERHRALPAHLAGICLQEAVWPRAKRAFSILPACSATASAGTCIIRNSHCSNGTGRMSLTRRCGPIARACWRKPRAATGSKRFEFRGRSVDPFAEPERVTVAEAFARHAGIDLLATIEAGQGDRVPDLPRRRRRPALPSVPATTGATSSAACWSSASSRSSATAAPRYYMSTRCRWPRWRAPSRAATRWPSVSSFMPAASNWPTASAN